MTMRSDARCWLLVVVFAIGMAFVESATVYDLRVMVDRIDPYQANPLPMREAVGNVELAREAATLVMLFAVGAIAGRTWQTRLGYTAIAFGVWDILYYVFLKVLCGWPHSLLDWDILFLVPLPWWGPVLAPLLISLLMIIWGTLAGLEQTAGAGRTTETLVWLISLVGVILALRVFMQETLVAAKNGAAAVRHVLPLQFNWSWFCLALGLMCAPAALAVTRFFSKRPVDLGPLSSLDHSGPVSVESTLSVMAQTAVTSRRTLER